MPDAFRREFVAFRALEESMSDPVFQQAYDTVRKSWSDAAWATLTQKQITEAIYREIRRIDAETAHARTAALSPAKRTRHASRVP